MTGAGIRTRLRYPFRHLDFWPICRRIKNCVFSIPMSTVRQSVVMGLLLLALPLAAQQWVPLGPDGGDVRTLTRDPYTTGRVLLSTSSGLIYESTDDGHSRSEERRVGKECRL